ncbi:ABC transporter ATP-binding protein [Frateuria sp. Soil773]|uniref:ABC transporter ATP-binding protein n=1 Tax=Frateuria sp. Soil773 TaxID=1736407 RepID=UPI001F425329|nr:ABC transporter ATP-binding protein [Frateuria sp. Soil773]
MEALKGISLSVDEGEYLAIVGSSGSGKSTLMNLIGLLDRPTSGIYSLNGMRVDKLHDRELSALRNGHIGFVFQSFHLLPRMTAIQNVMLPLSYRDVSRRDARALATSALRTVGLGGRQEHKPNEMSGGECQRVAIARALVGRPRLILADEPTGNLDSETTEEIMLLFEELVAMGNTLLIVTHENDVARRSNRIVRMRDGRILEDFRKEGL